MADFTLTALDVTGIQRYIFNSNRLQENVGASELVYRATHDIVFEKLPQPHNVDLTTGQLRPGDEETYWLEKGQVVAEVLYAGGGNVLILFKEEAQAKEFVTALSKYLLEIAPGLELLAAHVPVNWNTDPIGGQDGGREAVLLALEEVKNQRAVSTPLQGLGVTAACQSTGLAAVDVHPGKENNYLISAEVAAKLEWVTKANYRLIRNLNLPQLIAETRRQQGKYRIPFQLDDFGDDKNEISYIAVVHADGNGMGQKMQAISRRHNQAGSGNRRCINDMRTFSKKIATAAGEALKETVSALLTSLAEPGWLKEHKFTLNKDWLPFRPLVYGGDDLTFVCDGRLGLTLAQRYLQAFEKATQTQDEKSKADEVKVASQACAGIAVVKTHYPFARAYQLAEQLCGGAKKFVHRTASALDWHFAASGLLGELDDIRQAQYVIAANRLFGASAAEGTEDSAEFNENLLYMRPVRLHAEADEWRVWPNFSQATLEFKRGEAWADKRNKVIKLRQALRGGDASVSQYMRGYGIKKMPQMRHSQPAQLRRTGWADGICGYFDAIEAMDFFIPLK